MARNRSVHRIVLLSALMACAPTAGAQGIFFSEYVEGSSNNKALEIYNATDSPVDLGANNFEIRIFFSGSTTPGATIPLSGILNPGGDFVVVDDNATQFLLDVADQQSTMMFFNGDDAVALVGNGTTLDVIGVIGVDPGSQWGTGPTSTQDNTIRRLLFVTTGNPSGFVASPNDLTGEWDGFAQDTFSGLGERGEGIILSPGDYNNNRVVDAADYVVWRDFNGTNTTLLNDTTPGSVASIDYDVWKANFGKSIGSDATLSAIPEPSTLLLTIAALATLSPRRCKSIEG